MITACAPSAAEMQSLTVIVHDSFSISETVARQFEQANNAKLIFLKSGDAGTMLNKAILTKDAPLADVLYGVDNTFLSRALEAGIFERTSLAIPDSIPSEFMTGAVPDAFPIDYADVCINYDKRYFSKNLLSVPTSLEQLQDPSYKGLLVVEDPNTSSPGLAFMLATQVHFREAWLEYWQSLLENKVVIVDSWETAYYTNFSGSSGHGAQPLVVSYATSPAAEVIFADPPVDATPTGSIIGPETCFRQIEYVGIMKGTPQRDMAEKFIQFLLSEPFQEDIALQMFVFPVLPGAELPEAFVKYAERVEDPATLTPGEIMSNRDTWLEEWSQVMGR
jgi:thiamine transport system substrate-binding protein